MTAPNIVPDDESTDWPLSVMSDIVAPGRFLAWDKLRGKPSDFTMFDESTPNVPTIIETHTRAWTEREKLYIRQRWPEFDLS